MKCTNTDSVLVTFPCVHSCISGRKKEASSKKDRKNCIERFPAVGIQPNLLFLTLLHTSFVYICRQSAERIPQLLQSIFLWIFYTFRSGLSEFNLQGLKDLLMFCKNTWTVTLDYCVFDRGIEEPLFPTIYLTFKFTSNNMGFIMYMIMNPVLLYKWSWLYIIRFWDMKIL